MTTQPPSIFMQTPATRPSMRTMSRHQSQNSSFAPAPPTYKRARPSSLSRSSLMDQIQGSHPSHSAGALSGSQAVEKWNVAEWSASVDRRHSTKRAKLADGVALEREVESTERIDATLLGLPTDTQASSASFFMRSDPPPVAPPPSEDALDESHGLAILSLITSDKFFSSSPAAILSHPQNPQIPGSPVNLPSPQATRDSLSRLNRRIEESSEDFVLKMRAWEDRCQKARAYSLSRGEQAAEERRRLRDGLSLGDGSSTPDGMRFPSRMRGRKRRLDDTDDEDESNDEDEDVGRDWTVVSRSPSVDSARPVDARPANPPAMFTSAATASLSQRLSPAVSIVASDGSYFHGDTDTEMEPTSRPRIGFHRHLSESTITNDIPTPHSTLPQRPSISSLSAYSSSCSSSISTPLSASFTAGHEVHLVQGPAYMDVDDREIEEIAAYMQSGGGGLEDSAHDDPRKSLGAARFLLRRHTSDLTHADAGSLWS